MRLQRVDVAQALGTPSRFDAVIDARSPAEFALDHLPGALNWPTLDDEERRLVGTEYKQVSAFEARKRGAVLAARNIARHLDREGPGLAPGWRPLVYCWRGGQRSGALALVLAQVGFEVSVLEGGYRAFRRHVVEQLGNAGDALRLRVLCGRTGTGKSRLLQALAEAGAQVLDLEGLAMHRGSVLGSIPGQPQPSQKHFETRLWQALRTLQADRPVYIESESRLIGRLRVPEALLARMRASPCLRVEMPEAARVALLKDDYAHLVADRAELHRLLGTLREARGAELVTHWQALAAANRVDEVVATLLATHYDPIYLKSMARNFQHFGEAAPLHIEDGSDSSLRRAAARIVAEEAARPGARPTVPPAPAPCTRTTE